MIAMACAAFPASAAARMRCRYPDSRNGSTVMSRRAMQRVGPRRGTQLYAVRTERSDRGPHATNDGVQARVSRVRRTITPERIDELAPRDRPAPMQHQIRPEPTAEAPGERGLRDDAALVLDRDAAADEHPHATRKSQHPARRRCGCGWTRN